MMLTGTCCRPLLVMFVLFVCMAPAQAVEAQQNCEANGSELKSEAMRPKTLIQHASQGDLRRVAVSRVLHEPPEDQIVVEDVATARELLQERLEAPSTLPYNFTTFNANRSTITGSQFDQAMWVDHHLKSKTGLFVVESGAFDGEEFSNSIALETVRKWNCLLVEPNPAAQMLLRSKHRHCHVLNGAFSAGVELYSTNTLWMAGGLGGFNDTVRDRERAKQAVKGSQTIDGDRSSFSGTMVNVPTFRFDFVMNELGVKTVDYWSLDTEGSEPSIIENTDFNKVEVGLMTVEHNNNREAKDSILKAMTSKGFVRVMVLGLNDAYANPKYFEARGTTGPPPCGDICDWTIPS